MARFKPFLQSCATRLGQTLVLVVLSFSSAYGTAEFDQRFGLESIGLLPIKDNVDSILHPFVRNSFRDYFAQNQRFKFKDLSDTELDLQKKDAYTKLATDNRLQSFIRVRAQRSQTVYRFQLEWLFAPRLEVIATHSFEIQEKGPIQDFFFKEAIENGLHEIISKVPYLGHVSGREQNWITFVLGKNTFAKKGDWIRVGTIEDVQIHPLNKTFLFWNIQPTGKLEVDQISDGILFARVLEEEPQQKIGRSQKIIQVIPNDPPPPKPIARSNTDNLGPQLRSDEDTAPEEETYTGPRLGWLYGHLWAGSLSRQYSSLNATAGRSGSALSIGGRLEGQLWLSRSWFTEVLYGSSFYNYTQTDIETGEQSPNTALSGTASRFRANFGYNYFFSPFFFGPKAWARIGYQSTSVALPGSVTELIDSNTFGAIFLGIGGDLPLNPQLGAIFSIDFGLFRTFSETTLHSSTTSGSSDLTLFLGTYYRLMPNLSLRGGLEILSTGVSFIDGTQLSFKNISFIPGIQYYF